MRSRPSAARPDPAPAAVAGRRRRCRSARGSALACAMHAREVDQPEAVLRLVAEEQVPRDAQQRDEVDLLVDRADPGGLGVAVAGRTGTGTPAIHDLPAVGLVHTGEHLDQRGLAGAVLPDQGVHLPGAEARSTRRRERSTPANRFETPCTSRTTWLGRSGSAEWPMTPSRLHDSDAGHPCPTRIDPGGAESSGRVRERSRINTRSAVRTRRCPSCTPCPR